MSAPNAGQNMTAQSMPGQGAALPLAGSGNSKKIHTVAIHPGQDDADAAAPQAPAAPAPATASAHGQAARPAAPKPVRGAAAGRQCDRSRSSPRKAAPPPIRRGRAPRSRGRPRRAEPAPSAGGGYSVQVSSQRSEAEAQSAYRELQAKYPTQLGGRTPSVRQVNLGDKGVFYRTLVGPYRLDGPGGAACAPASKPPAARCIVQRN